MNHYLTDRRRFEHAQKRGGGQIPISIEVDLAENRFRKEFADDSSPEKLFDRGWALTVLKEAKKLLADEMNQRGHGKIYEEVGEMLTASPEPGAYKAIATRLAMQENAIRQFVSRMRGRFKDHLRTQVQATVSDPRDIDDEIGYLLSSFG